MILCGSVLAVCLVNGVKRNLDSTKAEILCEKLTRISTKRKSSHNTARKPRLCESGERSCATRKNSLRLEPVIDQRFDGIPKHALEQDQNRQTLISLLVNQVMNSSKKKEQMEEVFQKKERNSRLPVIVLDRSYRDKATLKRSSYVNSRTRFKVNIAHKTWYPVTSSAIVDIHVSLQSESRCWKAVPPHREAEARIAHDTCLLVDKGTNSRRTWCTSTEQQERDKAKDALRNYTRNAENLRSKMAGPKKHWKSGCIGLSWSHRPCHKGGKGEMQANLCTQTKNCCVHSRIKKLLFWVSSTDSRKITAADPSTPLDFRKPNWQQVQQSQQQDQQRGSRNRSRNSPL